MQQDIKEMLKKVASSIREGRVKIDAKQDFETLSKKASFIKAKILTDIISRLKV